MALKYKCDDCKKAAEETYAVRRTNWPKDGEGWLQPGAEWFTETKYVCSKCYKKYL